MSTNLNLNRCHLRMWGDLPNQGQLSWDSTSYHKRRKQWSSKKHLFNDYKAQITIVSWLKQQLRRTDSRGQPGLQVGRRRTFWQSDKTQRRSRCKSAISSVSKTIKLSHPPLQPNTLYLKLSHFFLQFLLHIWTYKHLILSNDIPCCDVDFPFLDLRQKGQTP